MGHDPQFENPPKRKPCPNLIACETAPPPPCPLGSLMQGLSRGWQGAGGPTLGTTCLQVTGLSRWSEGEEMQEAREQ